MGSSNPTFESDFVKAIKDRLGHCPAIYLIAMETPEVAQGFWMQTKMAYLDNPIPSLFKEKTFAYLSRFCDVDYSIAQHSAFLGGFGNPAGDPDCRTLSADEIIELLTLETPGSESIIKQLDALGKVDGPLTDWPDYHSPLENWIFHCLVPVFLRSDHFWRCQSELRRVLGRNWYGRLMSFLSFVRTEHFWTETHEHVRHDIQVLRFLEENPEISSFLDTYRSIVQLELNAGGDQNEELTESAKPVIKLSPLDKLRSVHETTSRITWDDALVDAFVTGVPDAFVLTDLNRNLTFCNPGVRRVFGYEPNELLGKPSSLLYAFQRDYEFQRLRRFNPLAQPDFEPFEVIRRRKNGTLFQGESVGTIILDRNGAPLGYLELVRDVSERKRKDEKQERRTQVLDAVSSGASLSEVLALVTALSENARPGMIGSILVFDAETKTLHNITSNKLPREYNDAIEGIRAGENIGSCGAAAFTGKRHIAEDILTDPNWAEFRGLANSANLRACWSEPILGSEKQVLGTLAMYFRRPQTPTELDLAVLKDCAQLAAIAIDRARALELLRKSEQRFDLAVRGSADGIWDWFDTSQENIWMSPRLYELIGFEPGEFEATISSLKKLVNPLDYPVAEKVIESHQDRNTSFDVEIRLQVKGGAYRWFRIRAFALRNETGWPIRLTGSLEDVHNRVVAEEEATSLGRLLEGSINEIFICDANTMKFVYVNQIARQNLGYSLDELASLSPADITLDRDEVSSQNDLELLRSGQEQSILTEHAHRRKDGSSYEVEVHLQFANYRGRPSFIAFVLDISERKRAEDERKVLERYVLNAASEEQRRIGHDLHDGVGQELTGLVMLADTLTMVLEKDSHPMTELANKISALTESSLDQVRKLARGLNPVEVDSQGLASALIELGEHIEQFYEVECVILGDQEVSLGNSETATQLFRIAQEAITNSVKHGNATRIEVTLLNVEGSVKLQIWDNGIGIDLENRPTLGTGIRSMSYRADLVGATLNILPHEKVGTIVTCTLP